MYEFKSYCIAISIFLSILTDKEIFTTIFVTMPFVCITLCGKSTLVSDKLEGLKQMSINKADVYKAVEERFPDPAFGTEVNTLTREILKLSHDWLEKNDNSSKTKRELRKDLKIYLKEQLVFDDPKKPYYFPAFVWIMIAQAVISFIVKYIINNYSTGRGS